MGGGRGLPRPLVVVGQILCQLLVAVENAGEIRCQISQIVRWRPLACRLQCGDHVGSYHVDLADSNAELGGGCTVNRLVVGQHPKNSRQRHPTPGEGIHERDSPRQCRVDPSLACCCPLFEAPPPGFVDGDRSASGDQHGSSGGPSDDGRRTELERLRQDRCQRRRSQYRPLEQSECRGERNDATAASDYPSHDRIEECPRFDHLVGVCGVGCRQRLLSVPSQTATGYQPPEEGECDRIDESANPAVLVEQPAGVVFRTGADNCQQPVHGRFVTAAGSNGVRSDSDRTVLVLWSVRAWSAVCGVSSALAAAASALVPTISSLVPSGAA